MSISAWLHLTPTERRKRKDRDTESIICHRPLSFSLHFCHLLNSFQLDALCLYKLVRLGWTDTRPPVRQQLCAYINSDIKQHSTVRLRPNWNGLHLLYFRLHIMLLLHKCAKAWHDWCGVCSVPTQITHRWRMSQEHRRGRGSRTHLWVQRAAMPPTPIHFLYVNLSALTTPLWFP